MYCILTQFSAEGMHSLPLKFPVHAEIDRVQEDTPLNDYAVLLTWSLLEIL